MYDLVSDRCTICLQWHLIILFFYFILIFLINIILTIIQFLLICMHDIVFYFTLVLHTQIYKFIIFIEDLQYFNTNMFMCYSCIF